MKPVVHLVQVDAFDRRATGRLLRAGGYEVIEYASAQNFLAANPQGTGCVVADIKMSQLNGLEMQDRLVRSGSTLVVVFMADDADIRASVSAIKAGAEDVLIKPTKKEDLLDAIDRALARSRQAVKNRSEQNTACSLVSTLTPREREVFSLVASGKPNKLIARELGTVERTIKAHRKKVMSKLHVCSLVDLMVFAGRTGLTTPIPPPAAASTSHKERSRGVGTLELA
ncbi:MAG TPA: LuxR C-terminal-related transcriptional regulator [Pseudorhodoplanes sp.]|nr:LuxR C-terminal-related transcriptional regulator [Pseudorhodoplanes sp.]